MDRRGGYMLEFMGHVLNNKYSFWRLRWLLGQRLCLQLMDQMRRRWMRVMMRVIDLYAISLDLVKMPWKSFNNMVSKVAKFSVVHIGGEKLTSSLFGRC